MEINISINCETFEELMQHLWKITDAVETRYTAIDELPFPGKIEFSDSNCYGDHNVEICSTE
jgi:hypothetical protein